MSALDQLLDYAETVDFENVTEDQRLKLLELFKATVREDFPHATFVDEDKFMRG